MTAAYEQILLIPHLSLQPPDHLEVRVSILRGHYGLHTHGHLSRCVPTQKLLHCSAANCGAVLACEGGVGCCVLPRYDHRTDAAVVAKPSPTSLQEVAM